MRRQWLVKAAVWTGIAGGLLSVFGLYTRPDFMITLANQVWTCF